MNRISTIDEEITIQKQSQQDTQYFNNSSTRRYLYSDWFINHTEYSDEELIRNFVETQDEEAFNEIVLRYADRIYILALRITGSVRDADYVLQNVFLTIEKLNTFRGESKFSNWIHRVVANASSKQIWASKKRYKREVSLENHAKYNKFGVQQEKQIKEWGDTSDEILLSLEEMEIMESAENEFPLVYRFVLFLMDIEVLTNHEVAEILGFSLPSVRSRLNRSRLWLRDKLSDCFHEWRK